MSLLAICCVTVGTVGLVQLAWLALKPLPEETGERGGERMEDLRALHAQHFPQLRQALANLDDDYLRRKASGEIERHTHAQPKHIVERFLAGLAEDFGRLQRLMTVLQGMSPAEPWIQQCERVRSRFQFRVNYRIASLRIRSEKQQSRNRLTRLTELVGNLSVRIEASMERVVRSASVPLRWATVRRALVETGWKSPALMPAAVRAERAKRLLCNAARCYSIRQIGISGS